MTGSILFKYTLSHDKKQTQLKATKWVVFQMLLQFIMKVRLLSEQVLQTVAAEAVE